MEIGIPRESFEEEGRVAITPAGVLELVRVGHQIIVESGAGERCGFSDHSYLEVGAKIVFAANEVYQRPKVIAKVMPPTEREVSMFEKGQILFSFVELGITKREQFNQLLVKNVSSFAWNLIQAGDGSSPVLTVMSEIAGSLVPQIAGRCLEAPAGGRGILLGGVSGIPSANVVVLGAGVVGAQAVRSFLGLGAQVMVIDRDLHRLRSIANQMFPKGVHTLLATPYNIEKACRFADVLVGAVLVPGEATPHLVTKDMVAGMKEGAVIIDVSIDQGGCIETSRPTTLSKPTYVVNGVIHYAVPNIPALVARTASHALNNLALLSLFEIGQGGIEEVLKKDTGLKEGLYTYDNCCTKKTVADYYQLQYGDPLEQAQA